MRKKEPQRSQRIEALATFMAAVLYLLPSRENIAYEIDGKAAEVSLDDAVVLTVEYGEECLSATALDGELTVKAQRASKTAMNACAALIACYLERCQVRSLA